MAFPRKAALLALACALSSGPALAEKLAIEGVYAARTDGARGVYEIAIEPIRGSDGVVLEQALTDHLGSASIYGEPVFRLVPPEFDPDTQGVGGAALHGYAGSRVYDVSDGIVEKTSCLREEVVDEDGTKACVESLTETFECRRLSVAFNPQVELTAGEASLYRRQDSFEQSERYCADSSYIPSAEAMLGPMISRFARLVRLDLAPEQRFDRVRILESRKGLERGDRKAFKHAIKLSKTDPVGACIAFEDILTRNPFQRSALYNVALCREADGELELAAEAYAHLIRMSDKNRFQSGLRRVESRVLAREQLASLDQTRLAVAPARLVQGPLGKPAE